MQNRAERADATPLRDPERNKARLIEAVLDSIAEVGIAETTVSRIIERAGVSRGMIHLHFGGKDKLLAAAAAEFSARYYTEMDRQIAGTRNDPAARIAAVVRADLSERILNERSAAIWHAFRGVARTNAAIARYSDTRDARLRSMIYEAFSVLLVPETAADRAMVDDVTLGAMALLEGMWTDFLTHPTSFSRDTSVRIVMRFLAAICPGKFPD